MSDLLLLDELLEIVQDDPVGQRVRFEVLAGHFHHQPLAGVVVEAVRAALLVGEQLLYGDVAIHAEIVPAHLEALLQFGVVAHEVAQDLRGERRLQEAADLVCEVLVRLGVDGGLGEEDVDATRLVSHHRHALVLQCPARLRGDGAAVEPHVLRHQPAVVGEHAVCRCR